MKSLLIAVLLASMPAAAEETCREIVVKVCSTKPKLVKKKIAKRRAPPVAPKPDVLKVPEDSGTPEITKVVEVTPVPVAPTPTPVAVVAPVETKEDPFVVIGLRAALGAGVRNEYDTWGHTSALLGLRARFPSLHLGLDAYTPFDYGTVAGQVLVYPFQGEKLNWQIGLGVMSTANLFLSTSDLPRTWDMTVGTGIEYKFVDWLALTVDWRASLPSPVFIEQNGHTLPPGGGRYLDVKHVIGNTLVQSQVLVGLMVELY